MEENKDFWLIDWSYLNCDGSRVPSLEQGIAAALDRPQLLIHGFQFRYKNLNKKYNDSIEWQIYNWTRCLICLFERVICDSSGKAFTNEQMRVWN